MGTEVWTHQTLCFMGFVDNKKSRISPALCIKFTFSASTPKHKLCNNWPPLLRSRVRVRCAERTKRQRQHEEKSDDGGKWERRGHGALILGFKDDPHSTFDWTLCVLRNTGRGGTVSPCTSHYLECNENSSLKHIIYMNYSINPEKYSAV